MITAENFALFPLSHGETLCCQVQIIAGKCVFLCRSLFVSSQIFRSEPKECLLNVTIRIVRFFRAERYPGAEHLVAALLSTC